MNEETVVLTEHTCLDVDQIENYLLRHLNELEIAVVEDKLLVCESIRPNLGTPDGVIAGECVRIQIETHMDSWLILVDDTANERDPEIDGLRQQVGRLHWWLTVMVVVALVA